MTQNQPPTPPRQSLSELLARPAAVQILIFAAAVLAFLTSAGFQFAYDDRFQIVDNPALTSWRGVLAYFTSGVWSSYDPGFAQNYYRPLFFVWFRINYMLFHLQPAGWHVMSVLLHAAASVLAFRVLLRMTRQYFVSAVAALLFAVHPIHIESVAWISGTTDPLMCIFLFGTLLFFLYWIEEGSALRLAASLLLFALALLCKEPAIMLLPFLAFWVCMAPEAKFSKPGMLFRGVLPMALLAGAYLAARNHALHGIAHSMSGTTWAQTAYTLPAVVLFYLRQTVLPIGLSFAYEMPVQSALTSVFFWGPLLVLLVVAALFAAWCVRSPRDRRTLLLAAAFWTFWMLPPWGLRWLPQEDLVHDRYLYLPVLGFCLAIGVALAQWRDVLVSTPSVSLPSETSVPENTAAPLVPPMLRPVVTAASLAAVLLAASFWQSLDCATDLLIWSRAYRVAPESSITLANLATVLFERGHMDDGFVLMQRALQKTPNSQVANFNMAFALHNAHNDRAAEPYAVRAVELSRQGAGALRLLGTIELNLGHPDAAEQLLRQAISRAPQGEGFHVALAIILLQRGNRAEAEREVQAELRLFPESPAARKVLAQIRDTRR